MRPSPIGLVAALISLFLLAPTARAGDGWTWPVRGRVVTAYVNDNARPYAGGMHRGIDIAAAQGTAVLAARGGTVTYAGALGVSGIVVAVRADDGRHVTSYLHLGAASVTRGERVASGARLGEVGTTGRRSVTEPHLHFGVRLADAEDHYVDPLSLLPAIAAADPAPPPPVAAPVPVRPQAQAAPAPAAAIARPRAVRAAGASRTPARPRGTLLPGPAPGAMPVGAGDAPPAASPGRPAPAGRVAGRPDTAGLRHPPSAAAAHARDPASEPGRPLLLAGFALVAVVLFGGALVRMNAAVSRGTAALVDSGRRRFNGLILREQDAGTRRHGFDVT